MLRFLVVFVTISGLSCQVSGHECGKVTMASGLVLGGSQSEDGQWPFTISLHLKLIRRQFFCAGTLVSHRHIVTAASCIRPKHVDDDTDSEEIEVSVGEFDLVKINSTLYNVSEIVLHPDWKSEGLRYDADIAVLILEEPLEFSDYIQPVCIPHDESITKQLHGFIVGWGKSESALPYENILRHARIAAVNNTACFLADHNLAQVASFRTFCAGGSKKGPCTGDSGAGFFVKIDDAWTLKGITSAGPLNPLGGCDAERYTVFTDVYKFHDWIQGIIDGKNGTEEVKNDK